LSKVIQEYTSSKPKLTNCESIDNYFAKLSIKDLEAQSSKVREYALVYYNCGNFSQFNLNFSRYIKLLKDMGDSELNDFLIKYLVSSVLKKNYANAIDDLHYLNTKYNGYDLNIYIL